MVRIFYPPRDGRSSSRRTKKITRQFKARRRQSPLFFLSCCCSIVPLSCADSWSKLRWKGIALRVILLFPSFESFKDLHRSLTAGGLDHRCEDFAYRFCCWSIIFRLRQLSSRPFESSVPVRAYRSAETATSPVPTVRVICLDPRSERTWKRPLYVLAYQERNRC
jgi:hypothetical protein